MSRNETQIWCVACHGQGGPGGAGPESKNAVILTAIPPTAKFYATIHPAFANTSSVVLHRHGTESAYASWRQRFYGGGHERPPASVNARGKDSPDERIRTLRQQVANERPVPPRLERRAQMDGPRPDPFRAKPPALFGAGQIDAVPEAVLITVEASQVGDVDGRIGRTSGGSVGRFGWKAQVSRLHEFVRVACAGELGLEVPRSSPGGFAPGAGEEGPGAGYDRERVRRAGGLRPGAPRSPGHRRLRAARQRGHLAGTPALRRRGLCLVPPADARWRRGDL